MPKNIGLLEETSNSIVIDRKRLKMLWIFGSAILVLVLIALAIIVCFTLFEAKNKRYLVSRHPTGIFRKGKN